MWAAKWRATCLHPHVLIRSISNAVSIEILDIACWLDKTGYQTKTNDQVGNGLKYIIIERQIGRGIIR